jgi:CheY-like chemotaxis protein
LRIGKTVIILMAEDDPDDRLLVKEAMAESQLVNTTYFVENGEELLDYLCQRGKYANAKEAPRPGLIFLDLNMPRKDGREALQEIKADPLLRQIPIVIFTTSKAEEDIWRAYELGASSFITKPVTFDALVDVMKTIGKYWFEIVELPPPNQEH